MHLTGDKPEARGGANKLCLFHFSTLLLQNRKFLQILHDFNQLFQFSKNGFQESHHALAHQGLDLQLTLLKKQSIVRLSL